MTLIELRHDKTKQNGCAPSDDSDQPGHPPSLIRVFAVRRKKAWVISYPTERTAKTLIRCTVFTGRTQREVIRMLKQTEKRGQRAREDLKH